MLELSVATYRYPGYARSVLHDIELRLGDGEIVGLVGPNDAGKSTLCLVAAGLAPASIGGVLKGTLTLDHEPHTNVDDINERSEGIRKLLESKL